MLNNHLSKNIQFKLAEN